VAAGVVAVLTGAAFLAAADFVVLIAVPGRLMEAADFVPLARAVPDFFTTVAVLPSLDSLPALIFRLPRVVLGGPAVLPGTGVLRPRAGADAAVVAEWFELDVEDIVSFLPPAVALRIPLAFSTIFERRFVEDFVANDLTGDTGRPSTDLVGDMGRSRGRMRPFDDVGDKIWCD